MRHASRTVDLIYIFTAPNLITFAQLENTLFRRFFFIFMVLFFSIAPLTFFSRDYERINSNFNKTLNICAKKKIRRLKGQPILKWLSSILKKILSTFNYGGNFTRHNEKNLFHCIKDILQSSRLTTRQKSQRSLNIFTQNLNRDCFMQSHASNHCN